MNRLSKSFLMALAFAPGSALCIAAQSTSSNPAEPAESSKPKTGISQPSRFNPSGQLTKCINGVCWSLHRNHQDKAEFKEAYREAFELLEIAEEIDESIRKSGSAAAIAELIEEFQGEIHHVEHHIQEFAALSQPKSGATVDEASERLDVVKSTLKQYMAKYGGHAESDKKHEHGNAKKKSGVPLTQLTKDLEQRLSAFYSSLNKNHKDKADFKEADEESSELLQMAKQVDKLAQTGDQGKAIKELLVDLDGEFHHVEKHVTAFAAGGKVTIEAEEDATVQSLENAEATLHQLLVDLDLQGKHVQDHKHAHKDHESTEKPSAIDKEQALKLAGDLIENSTIFCNVMRHNYKSNPDFKEAYQEALELYELSKTIEGSIQSTGIEGAVREQLVDFDGEIHHVEKHVATFAADDDGLKDGPRRLKRKLEIVERTLHSLMSGLGVKRKHAEHDEK
jgi:hypothetical protein